MALSVNHQPIITTKENLSEALLLSNEILKNLELDEISLTNCTLKCSRLARLLNEFDYQKIMEYEVGGYPSSPDGVPFESWRLGKIAGRVYESKVDEDIKEFMYTESIQAIEQRVNSFGTSMLAAKDPDVSISSSNPNQFVQSPLGNIHERNRLHTNYTQDLERLAQRKSFIYSYALQRYYNLKFSEISDDVFSRIRLRVDTSIGNIIPEAVKQFTAVYDNLKSENPEDWSNAVHSCRRILQSLADELFPPAEDKKVIVNGKEKLIKLGKDNYINRLIQFVDNQSSSGRFNSIVGSHLGFLGDRLDSIFQAAQKGSHSMITDKEEAERYVIYIYLIVGDILTLIKTD